MTDKQLTSPVAPDPAGGVPPAGGASQRTAYNTPKSVNLRHPRGRPPAFRPSSGSGDEGLFATLTTGGRIRYMMEVRGMTQTELAARIGVGQAAISNLVTDKSRKPSARTLLAMARAFDISPEWILHGPGTADVMPLPQTFEIQVLWGTLTPESQAALLHVARHLLRVGNEADAASAVDFSPPR
jgi:transcriptional regulator with XRE-family HTH domain